MNYSAKIVAVTSIFFFAWATINATLLPKNNENKNGTKALFYSGFYFMLFAILLQLSSGAEKY